MFSRLKCKFHARRGKFSKPQILNSERGGHSYWLGLNRAFRPSSPGISHITTRP